MNTKEKLETELKDAMRSQNEVKKRTIRMVLSAIKLAEVEKGKPIEESALLALIQKELKGRRESIEDARKANRPDIIAENEEEIAVLEAYLPPPLGAAELEQIVRAAIQEAGASNPSEMGKVMKIVMPKIEGRATGDQISQVVRQLLQAH